MPFNVNDLVKGYPSHAVPFGFVDHGIKRSYRQLGEKSSIRDKVVDLNRLPKGMGPKERKLPRSIFIDDEAVEDNKENDVKPDHLGGYEEVSSSDDKFVLVVLV